jgi:hypothetical protein
VCLPSVQSIEVSISHPAGNLGDDFTRMVGPSRGFRVAQEQELFGLLERYAVGTERLSNGERMGVHGKDERIHTGNNLSERAQMACSSC